MEIFEPTNFFNLAGVLVNVFTGIVAIVGLYIEYSDKSTPRVPDESTPDLVTNNPSYFTTGLY